MGLSPLVTVTVFAASVVSPVSVKSIGPAVVMAPPLSVAVEAPTVSAALAPVMLGSAALPWSAAIVRAKVLASTSLAMVMLPLLLVQTVAAPSSTAPTMSISRPAVRAAVLISTRSVAAPSLLVSDCKAMAPSATMLKSTSMSPPALKS